MQLVYTKEMNELRASVPEQYWAHPENAPEKYREKIARFDQLFEEHWKEAHRVLLGIEL